MDSFDNDRFTGILFLCLIVFIFGLIIYGAFSGGGITGHAVSDGVVPVPRGVVHEFSRGDSFNLVVDSGSYKFLVYGAPGKNVNLVSGNFGARILYPNQEAFYDTDFNGQVDVSIKLWEAGTTRSALEFTKLDENVKTVEQPPEVLPTVEEEPVVEEPVVEDVVEEPVVVDKVIADAIEYSQQAEEDDFAETIVAEQKPEEQRTARVIDWKNTLGILVIVLLLIILIWILFVLIWRRRKKHEEEMKKLDEKYGLDIEPAVAPIKRRKKTKKKAAKKKPKKKVAKKKAAKKKVKKTSKKKSKPKKKKSRRK